MKILKTIKFIFLLLVVVVFGIITENYIVLEKKDKSVPILETTTKEKLKEDTKVFKKSIGSYIGKDVNTFIKIYGKPQDKYKSAYDYDWMMFKRNSDYIFIGVKNNKIITAFVTGSGVNVAPFKLGESQEQIFQRILISEEISFKLGNNTYQMELSENDLMSKPITKIDNTWVQLYFDKVYAKLVGIRYLQSDTLIKQKPFETMYSGELIKPDPISDKDWIAVNKGNEKQILVISNYLRNYYGIKSLERNFTLDVVAYKHSEDMFNNSFFAHESPTKGNLETRLIADKIQFALAGENIASKYIDGIDVTFGWLNSENHRTNLLSKDFNQIGIGVVKDHFTQEFTKK
ncbi:MAG: rane protein [Bacillales bacterium]|nr:rane protein [Bacillales bacterium]